MAVQYSSEALAYVKLSIDWQCENNAVSIKRAVEAATDGEWHEAAYNLLYGQRHNQGVGYQYLRYFPCAVQYAAAKRGVQVEFAMPNFAEYNEAKTAVHAGINWVNQQELQGAMEQMLLQDMVRDFLALQRHNASEQKLWLRYFPYAYNYATARFGFNNWEMRDPELEDV